MTEEAVVVAQEPAAPPPAEVTTPEPAESAPATPEQSDATEKRHTSRFERRISKLYRRLGEADARAQALQKELDSLKQPAAPDGAPRLEQFDDIEKFAKAREEWGKTQAQKDFEARQRQTQQQELQKKLTSSWEEKVSAAQEKYDDWDDLVGEIQPTSPLAIALMREESGAEVAYHLAKSPNLAMKIAGMDPVDQFLAVGRLAAQLAATPPEPKKPTSAPPPIQPVSGKTGAQAEELMPDDDMKTFIRKRNRQLGRVK